MSGPPAAEPPAHTVRSEHPVPSRSAVVAARRRAAVLTVLLVSTVGCWALVALPSPVPPAWAATPVSVLLLLDLVALRAAARRRERRRVAEAAAARRAEDSVDVEASGGRAQGRPLPGRPAVPPAVRSRGGADRAAAASDRAAAALARTARPAATAGRSGAGGEPAAPPAARAVGAEARGWADRQWEDETGEIVGVERPNPLAADEGWEPVAVPPPTYALKPVVHRYPHRVWEPAREFADDLDLDEVLARRRAVNG